MKETAEDHPPAAPTNHNPFNTYSHHIHDAGHRLRQFLRPDGRKVHVAASPEELNALQRKLTACDDKNFEVVIHGSLDHINALREIHSHHENEREKLKVKHGAAFNEFERVVRELDRLNDELHEVSEHAVNLDANFSKYGYSATLRSLPQSGGTSRANSIHEHEHTDWVAQKNMGDHMVFFRTPLIRQYLHKGLLWRAEESLEVASYEVFVDLFYVGILAIAGDGAVQEATGQALLRFSIVFCLAWKVWGELTTYMSWIAADDIIRRLSVLFFLVLLLGLTVNMADSWEETYKPLVAFYLASRWFGGFYFIWTGTLIPMVRNSLIANGIISILPGALWIGSIYVPQPQRQILIWIAIPLDIFGPVLLIILERGGTLGKRLNTWAKKTFEFVPGTSIEHKIERTNSFVSLVFGYSVVSLLYQSRVPFGINAFFGKAVLGLIQSFTFNWLYFEIDVYNMHTHAIRRHFLSTFLWLSAHLPFTMGFTFAGATLSKIVLCHDTEHSDVESLLEPYNTRSNPELGDALRWFYCAGLGIALLCMGIISASHSTKRIPNAFLHKPFRLAVRFAGSIVILLLPLAKDRLNSLELVATTTGIVFVVLLVELAGTACKGDSFWGFKERRKCTYSAKCNLTKKELIQSAKSGEMMNVEEIAKRDRYKDEPKEGYTV